MSRNILIIIIENVSQEHLGWQVVHIFCFCCFLDEILCFMWVVFGFL